MTVTTTRKFAPHIALYAMRRCRQILDQHERDCAYDRANGHRPHYCIHGTNQWTDYDNICPGCEDSVFGLRIAVQIAHDLQYQWEQRTKIVRDAAKAGAPDEIRIALAQWCADLTDDSAEKSRARVHRLAQHLRSAPAAFGRVA